MFQVLLLSDWSQTDATVRRGAASRNKTPGQTIATHRLRCYDIANMLSTKEMETDGEQLTDSYWTQATTSTIRKVAAGRCLMVEHKSAK